MLEYIFGGILLLAALFLIVAVLLQSGKSHGLSGTIAGGAETFFGKTKAKSMDKLLSKLTTIVAILFAVLVIVVYVIQDDADLTTGNTGTNTPAVTTAADETTVADDTTGADDTTVADDTTGADDTTAADAE